MDRIKLTRRTTLALLGTTVMASIAPQVRAAASEDWMTDPRKVLNTYVRMQSDISGKVTPWAYHGHVLAVVRDKQAQVLYDCEGAETKKVFVRDDGFELWSKVMTLFRDPDTGEVLVGKPWKNPITGAMNTVTPNVIGSKTLLRVSDGKIIEERSINGAPARPVELTGEFTVYGDKVVMEFHRNPPRPWPAETKSFATNTAELAHVRDPNRPRIEATFSGSDVVPWQSFMEMPEGLGHAVWHTNGKKMHGFDELSAEYLEQARIYIPDVLDWMNI